MVELRACPSKIAGVIHNGRERREELQRTISEDPAASDAINLRLGTGHVAPEWVQNAEPVRRAVRALRDAMFTLDLGSSSRNVGMRRTTSRTTA